MYLGTGLTLSLGAMITEALRVGLTQFLLRSCPLTSLAGFVHAGMKSNEKLGFEPENASLRGNVPSIKFNQWEFTGKKYGNDICIYIYDRTKFKRESNQ